MRIALIAPLVAAIREPQRGGSQAFVADLARGLLGRGHEVHLYAAAGSEVPGGPGDRCRRRPEGAERHALPGLRCRCLRGRRRRLAFAAVYSALRGDRYDVIHNHAFDAPAVSLAGDLPAPVVHTVHLPPDEAVAGALRQATDSEQPANGRGGVRVPGKRLAANRPGGRRSFRPSCPTGLIEWSPESGEGAVFAGRLSPEKGAAEAIEIARAAGVRIDLYGDSYDSNYERDRIDPQRTDPDVSVHRAVPRPDLWAAMARAAVVLCPAMWDEPFGMLAAEAQACGTPVVAFKRRRPRRGGR